MISYQPSLLTIPLSITIRGEFRHGHQPSPTSVIFISRHQPDEVHWFGVSSFASWPFGPDLLFGGSSSDLRRIWQMFFHVGCCYLNVDTSISMVYRQIMDGFLTVVSFGVPSFMDRLIFAQFPTQVGSALALMSRVCEIKSKITLSKERIPRKYSISCTQIGTQYARMS